MDKSNMAKSAILFCLLLPPAFAENDIISVNNQATTRIEYDAMQINNSIRIDNSQYLKGHQLGLNMDISKTFWNRLYTRVASNAMSGNLSYGKFTELSSASNVWQQINVRMGYSFYPNDKIAFTPYATTGYQYWQLDTGGKRFRGFNRNGDTRFYQNGFFGLGLLSQWSPAAKWVASGDIMFGKTYNPWMRYNAPEVPSPIIGPNIVYQQAMLASQPYYQIGVGIDYRLTKKIHANAGVQYNHYEYSSARTKPSQLVLPHVSISNWNYQVGVGYSLDNDSDNTLNPDNPVLPADLIIHANNQAALWYGYTMQNYAETVPGIGHYFDRQQGNIPVISISFSKTFSRLYSQLSLSQGVGNTSYKGELLDGTPSNASTRNTLLDIALRIGYMFFPNDKSCLTPYIIGGYHRWLRDIAGVPYGGYLVSGYPETYQHAWYGAGLLAQLTPAPNIVINMDGNFGTTKQGQNASWNSFNSPKTYQQTFSLKQRFFYNIGLGGDYRFARHWHALAQYNYLHFKYGLSASSRLGIYEPNSKTHQASIMIGIGYDL